MFNIGLVDSLRIRVKLDKIKILDNRLISDYIQYYPDINILDEEVRKAPPYVRIINGITYRFYVKAFIDASKMAHEYLVLQLSAKMLKQRYFEGITKNNIDFIIKDINALQIFEIKKSVLLDGLVSDIDICLNQLIDLNSYKIALTLIQQYPKESKKPLLHFINKSNNKGSNLGIDFNKREKATNSLPYCKIYHKGFELLSKSITFYKSYLEPLKSSFLDNLVRYEFTIKAYKHKEYLCNKGFKADFKTLNDLLNVNPKELTKIAKSGLKHYIEEHKNTRQNKETSPTDIMIKYYIENLINLGFPTDKLLGFTYNINDASSRSRTKTKAKKLIDEMTSVNNNLKQQLKRSDKAKHFLKNLGFE